MLCGTASGLGLEAHSWGAAPPFNTSFWELRTRLQMPRPSDLCQLPQNLQLLKLLSYSSSLGVTLDYSLLLQGHIIDKARNTQMHSGVFFRIWSNVLSGSQVPLSCTSHIMAPFLEHGVFHSSNQLPLAWLVPQFKEDPLCYESMLFYSSPA